MELRVLTYFLMVAREENITKAAQLLHVTQPTLSRQLIQLEDELGTKLFIRGSHNLTLTPEGRLLKRRAQDIVSLSDKTIREFQFKKEDLYGDITIGSGELLCLDSISPLITEFQSKHNNVHFNMRSSDADDIKDRIESGLVDIGILANPGDISKFESIPFPQTEVNGVMVPNTSPLAKKEFVTPEDLHDKKLIFTSRISNSNNMASWFGKYYEKLNIVATFNLMYNASTLVKSGLGIAFGIKLNWNIDGVTFVPLLNPPPVFTYFVWKKNETLAPATKSFIEFVQENL